MIMLLSDSGPYISTIISIATCAFIVTSCKYFSSRNIVHKQETISDLPPGAVLLSDYLNSLQNNLKTKSDPSMEATTAADPIPELTSLAKPLLRIDRSSSFLSSDGTTPKVIAVRITKESEKKVSSGRMKKRWSSGQFPELNL